MMCVKQGAQRLEHRQQSVKVTAVRSVPCLLSQAGQERKAGWVGFGLGRL